MGMLRISNFLKLIHPGFQSNLPSLSLEISINFPLFLETQFFQFLTYAPGIRLRIFQDKKPNFLIFFNFFHFNT